jgi:hypothetical protein
VIKRRELSTQIGSTLLVCHNSKSKVDLPALDMEVIAIIPTGEGIFVGNRIKGQAIFCATKREAQRELAATFREAADYLDSSLRTKALKPGWRT